MTRRMLDSSIWSNESFSYLPPYGRLLLIGMVNHADDQGRIKGNPAYLRSQIFPYDDITVEEIETWLESIERNGTVLRYEIDGKWYVQMLNWWEYQSMNFAAPSDYPAPDGWRDRIRYTGKGRNQLTYNWTDARGKPIPDSCDCRGKPLSVLMDVHIDNHIDVHKADKDKDKDKEKEKEGDRRPYGQPHGHKDPSSGLPSPSHSREKQNADHYTAQARQHGVEPKQFRLMTDLVLDVTGKRALADTELDDKWLNRAKQAALCLAKMSFTSADAVQTVIDSWRKNDYRGKTAPTFDQLQEHASAMQAGTVKPHNPNLWEPNPSASQWRETQARLPGYMRDDN